MCECLVLSAHPVINAWWDGGSPVCEVAWYGLGGLLARSATDQPSFVYISYTASEEDMDSVVAGRTEKKFFCYLLRDRI